MTDPNWHLTGDEFPEPHMEPEAEPAHKWNWIDFACGALVLLAVGGIAGSMVYGRFV